MNVFIVGKIAKDEAYCLAKPMKNDRMSFISNEFLLEQEAHCFFYHKDFSIGILNKTRDFIIEKM